MSLEVHAHTRGKLRPDPELDPILAVFYFIHNDWPHPDGSSENSYLGVIAIAIQNAKFTSFVGKSPPPPISSPPHSSHVGSTPSTGSHSPATDLLQVKRECTLIKFICHMIIFYSNPPSEVVHDKLILSTELCIY